MSTTLETFRGRIESLDLRDGLNEWPAPLKMRESGPWATWYAPFEHVNAHARIAIVGITPGLQQAGNALRAYQRARGQGETHDAALAAAKVFASFSGPMRANLVALLDAIGIASLLGIDSCARLFTDRSDLVHFTSALRFPVTLAGRNYGGTPDILGTDYTRREFEDGFLPEAATLRDALWVPLGPSVTKAIASVAARGLIEPRRVLAGLPHPSGANAERVAYFLGRKERAKLSTKVDPARLDAARGALVSQIAALTR